MKYLLVVAHPDDECLGAGATIHKLVRAGNPVAVATMASRAAARVNLSSALAEEQARAFEILGIGKAYAADFPNIKMNAVPHLELVQFIEGCIQDFGAEAIITHHPSDTNIDHAITSGAAQAAAHLFQRREGVPALRELRYMETASATEWSLDSSLNRFLPNHYVEIGEDGLEVKLRALACYKGVMRPYPHPRSAEALRGLAAWRGAQAGCLYAEAFETVFRRD